jgi:hypothetical protein
LVDQCITFLVVSVPPSVPPTLPEHPNLTLFKSLWPVLDSLLLLDSPPVTSSICRLLVKVFDKHSVRFTAVVHELAPRLAELFESSQCTSLMWAASRLVRVYGRDEVPLGPLCLAVVERMSQTSFKIVQDHVGKIRDIPDGKHTFPLLFEKKV